MKETVKKILSTVLSAAFLINTTGCATSTITRKENVREVPVKKTPKTGRVLLGQSYSLDSVGVNEAAQKIYGTVLETRTTAAELTVEKERRYNLVTYKERERLVVEIFPELTSELFDGMLEGSGGGPGDILAIPLAPAFAGIICLGALPFELAKGHGLSGEYAEKRVSKVSKTEPIHDSSSDYTDRQQQTLKASSVPVMFESDDIFLGTMGRKSGRTASDYAGAFSVPFSFPADVYSPAEIRSRALGIACDVFIRRADAEAFLKAFKFPTQSKYRVSVSVENGDTERVYVSGTRLNSSSLMGSLREYLLKIMRREASLEEVRITVEVKDAISHTEVSGETDVRMEFVSGVTKESARQQMLEELRKYVKPQYVQQFAPKDSDLPDIRRAPEKFSVRQSREFWMHVPATYRIKATNPNYVFVDGAKSFSIEEKVATIYMDDKGGKQRISIDTGSKNGRVE